MDVKLPDGTIVRNVPEGTTKSELMRRVKKARSQGLQQARQSGDREQFGEMMQQGIDRNLPQNNQGSVGDILRAPVQGATYGFSDEIAGAMGAIPAALATGQSIPEAYKSVRDYEREQLERIRRDNPYLSLAGEVAGGVLTGGAAIKGAQKVAPELTEEIAKYAGKNLRNRLAASAGLGAISGGVYGLGTGGTPETSRAEAALQGGALGSVGGLAGSGAVVGLSAAGRRLSDRARKLLGRPRQVEQPTGTQLAETQSYQRPEVLPEQSDAYAKIESALRKDFGDNYEAALNALKSGDTTLADLYGKQTRTLAKGAAQFPGGAEPAEEFFSRRVSNVAQELDDTISKNISSNKAYYATVDDIAEAGRAKAAPLYKKAYNTTIKNAQDVQKPEVQNALERAYRQFPSELDGVEPTNLKALDYAKRVLDDDINKAMRAGERNLARSRIEIKNQLLEAMDEASPAYAQARREAGDYLQLQAAMDKGKDFMRQDPELLTKQLAKLSKQEKLAYRTGVAKALRDKVDKGLEGRNVYNQIFGREEQKKRLRKILTPTQYKNLEQDLKATDRLFRLRQEVLGGSPTASKQVASEMVEAGVPMADVHTLGASTLALEAWRKIARKFTNVRSDKIAKEVADIIYEDRPAEKLKIINNLSGKRYLSDAERKQVKEAALMIDDAIRTYRPEGAMAGGIIGQKQGSE